MKYLLMHKRTAVLELDIDKLGMIAKIGAVSAPEHLPVGVRTSKSGVDRASFNEWWADRCIPANRSGMRDAFQVLGAVVPQQLLSRSYGLSLSDHYWLKPTDSALTWEQINFFDNPFSDDIGDILFGKQHGAEIDFASPDITTDGNLKKRWRIINGKRCLMKGGSEPFYPQPFNEVIASAVMRRLGISHIPYTVTWGDEHPYSVCENFVTPDTELVPAWRVYQLKKKPNSSSVFQHYIDICAELGIQNISRAMDEMLVVDFLIANEDRHFNNFGLLRNPETLEWIGAAPIFDSGSSLGYDSLPNRFLSANIPCKPFKKTHAAQIQLVSSFDWIDFSKLDGIADEIQEILSGERTAEFIDEARRNAIANAVVKRIAMLKEIAQQHTNTDDLSDDLTENIAQTY